MQYLGRTWVIGGLALLVTFSGCDLVLGERGAGSLELLIDGSGQTARSIGPAISVEIDHYVVTGRSDSGSSFEQTSRTTSVVVDGLEAGYWDVIVGAYNVDGVHLYTGSRRVLIRGRAVLATMVTLAPVPGYGTLGVGLAWPAAQLDAPVVDAVLVPGVGTALPLEFTVTGDEARYDNDQVASGYHTLIVKLKDHDLLVAGAVELVQIVSGQSTEASFGFTDVNAPGGLEIGIEVAPEFSASLAVSVSGGEVTAAFGEPVTLSGAVEGETPNAVFTWYVNGTAVDSGVAAIVIGGEVPGYYRVDLIVITADGRDGGMATTWVRIAEPGV